MCVGVGGKWWGRQEENVVVGKAGRQCKGGMCVGMSTVCRKCGAGYGRVTSGHPGRHVCMGVEGQ